MTRSQIGGAIALALLGACDPGGRARREPFAITVAAPSSAVASGFSLRMSAFAWFRDGGIEDRSRSVQWTTDDPDVAAVDGSAGNEGLVLGLVPGVATITAHDAATGLRGSFVMTVTTAALVSIGVTPADPSIALGTGSQFAATGTFSDQTTQDLTTGVTWSSSSPQVATISNAGGSQGLASSASVGVTTIEATHSGSSVSGSTTLAVTPAVLVSIEVTPADPSIALGTGRQFAATGTFSDQTTQDLTTGVTWSSSSPSVATISNANGSQGLASSASVGVTTIAATHAGSSVSGATTLTVTPAVVVSIEVTPADPSIALGTGRQFAATGTFSDQTTQDLTTGVTWSSSSPSVATISNANGSQGLASSASVGVTTIAATHAGTSVSGATTLTVLDGITLRGASSDGEANGVLSLGLTTPSGTLSGDVLLAAIAIRPHTVTITAPAGWTLVRRVDNAATNQNSLAVYRRVAAASEPTTHTFTFSASSGSAGGIVAFYGVDTTTPVDVEAGQTTSSGLSHATPAVVTTVADAMVFTAHGFSSSATWTPPAGMVETFEAMSQGSANAAGVSVSGNHAEQAAAGSTGGRSAVASAHADVGNAVVVVLRPVP